MRQHDGLRHVDTCTTCFRARGRGLAPKPTRRGSHLAYDSAKSGGALSSLLHSFYARFVHSEWSDSSAPTEEGDIHACGTSVMKANMQGLVRAQLMESAAQGTVPLCLQDGSTLKITNEATALLGLVAEAD